ncbi:MAG TPA: HdeD family acid-resistance protein [Steroidobacteraceae bacterium]|nr:HdeD family acid-resistance protein [Steroidobacteraceae bacterium]
MLELLSRHWWTLVLRGIAAIVFGLLAWFSPGITLAVLVLFFGAYVLVDGVIALYSALSKRSQAESRWLVGLLGALGILIGVLTLGHPSAAALALLLYIAAWSLVTGVLQIVAAIRLRKEIQGEFWLGLAGALSIAFAVLVLMFPAMGALSIVWVIAAYAIVYGVALLLLGLKVRKLHKAVTPKAASAH